MRWVREVMAGVIVGAALGVPALPANATATCGGRNVTKTTYDSVINGGTVNSATVWYGTTGTDVIQGSSGSDWLLGDAGNDYLCGLAGVDAVAGGAGDDYLQPGNGSDHVDGGTGIDTISYSGLSSPLFARIRIDRNLFATVNPTNPSNPVDTDAVVNVENVNGSNQNDRIAVGSSTAPSRIARGGPGDDILVGYAGTTLYGGDGADICYQVTDSSWDWSTLADNAKNPGVTGVTKMPSCPDDATSTPTAEGRFN